MSSALIPPSLAWPWPILPELQVAGLFPMLPENGFTYHLPRCHAFHLYLYEGEIEIGGRPFRLFPGAVTLTPAATASRYRLSTPGRHWCVHFLAPPPAAAESAGPPLALPLFVDARRRQEYLVERLRQVTLLFNRIQGDGAAARPFRQLAGAAFAELLWGLAAPWAPALAAPQRSPRLEQALDRVASLIEEHLAQPITIPWLARQVGIDHNHLARAFRQRHGMTMVRFLQLRRLERARFLLAGSPLTVRAISAQVGIPDTHHFTKLFRRHTGMSPAASRRIPAGAVR